MPATTEASNIVALRRALAQAERRMRERAGREAVRLTEMERLGWREAQANCLQLEQIRRQASTRLETIQGGGMERFTGESVLAEMALKDVERWALRPSAAYTIVSFARLRDRLRYVRDGAEREAVMRETLACGGVYTERGYFQEILK
jgi:hypothetical protein